MRASKWKLFSTLRGRIVVVYTLLFACAFFFINLSVSQLVGGFLVSERTQSQRQLCMEVAARLSSTVAEQDAATMYALCVSLASELDGRVLVLDNDGIVLADSYSRLNGHLLTHPEVQQVVSGEKSTAYGYHKVDNVSQDSLFSDNKSWAAYYTSVITYQSRNVGVALISVSIQDVVDLTMGAVTRFAAVSVGILALLIVASVVVSRWISLPIAQMTGAIKQMSHGKFDARVHVKGASEIAEMGRTFNVMSEQLQNVDRQRGDFVANASHELKTPLSAIKILTESLLYQEHVPEETYKEFLMDINAQIDRLNSLLGDLLILAQSDRSSNAMHYTTESLDAILTECVRMLTPLAQEKQIELVTPLHHAQMKCDRLKLTTAVMNLISNGIKYTPNGGKVTAQAWAENGTVYIEVKDTGIGIPKADQAHIFERFYRVDKARSRETGGTGLGLAIVQQITRLHGGRIRVESEEQQGSTFTIELPQWGLGV